MRGQINAYLTFLLNQAWVESTRPAHHSCPVGIGKHFLGVIYTIKADFVFFL